MNPLRASLLASLILTGCVIVPPPARAPAPVREPDTGVELQRLATLLNRHRERVGCRALIWHDATGGVAQRHSEDMVRRGYFAHENPEGRTPFDRLRAAGVAFSRAAENIAYGQPTAEVVLDSWLRSAGHRDNLENCAYTHHGLGVAERHWTHVLVTPR